ncbi:MAG: cell division protein FtsQ/DivIB [Nitrospirae bacterium]|nr:cell division protein FtsQ/DivIB [Nitrospirota bacterium]
MTVLNKRNLRSLQRKKESKKLSFAIVLCVLCIATTLGIFMLVKHVMKVTDMSYSGLQHLKGEDLSVLIRTGKGEELFGSSGSDIYRRLKKSPWVKDAAIRRDLSGRLSVKVQEAVPGSILKLYESDYLVSEDGVVLEKISDSAIFLPVIKDIDPAKSRDAFKTAVDLVRTLHAKGAISYKGLIEVAGQRPEEITLTFDNIRIRIGAGDFEKKLERLKFVRDEIEKRNMNVDYIDLRFSNKVIVKPVNGDAVVSRQG